MVQTEGYRDKHTQQAQVKGCVQGSYAVREEKLSDELRGCSIWEEQVALQDTPEDSVGSALAGEREGASMSSGTPRLQDGLGVDSD